MKTIYRCDSCQFDDKFLLKKPNCSTNQLRYPCTFKHICIAYKKKNDEYLNTLDIIKKYLEENNYDGLYNNVGCACKKEDLAPCSTIYKCKPGYLIACSEIMEEDNECDFCIGLKE